ncbi:MAG: hypothetical protein QOE70_3659 [Chthoniobacter sp.]|jgi:hypothetical protein|nr:hypothetical protein [Chthoniobacter sp.]
MQEYEIYLPSTPNDGSATFDLPAFKESIKEALQQEAVLIIAREATAV